MKDRIIACLTCLLLTFSPASPILSVGNASDQIDRLSFRIADSQSRVGFFAVKLSVGLLTQEDGSLVGDYVIDIPLFTSKSDHGRIVLPIDIPLEQISTEGGRLTGKAYSEKKPGEVHQVVCTIHPLDNKGIQLAVTTSKRTVHFSSAYELLETELKGP